MTTDKTDKQDAKTWQDELDELEAAAGGLLAVSPEIYAQMQKGQGTKPSTPPTTPPKQGNVNPESPPC